MTSEMFGGDSFIVLIIVFVALVIPIWALIDSISRPSRTFTAAGSSKEMWIALIVVFWFFTGIVGVVLSIIYLVSIRPRVKAVMP